MRHDGLLRSGVLAAGEGALAGLVAGLLLWAWDARIGGYLHHGHRWLLLARLPECACWPTFVGLGVGLLLWAIVRALDLARERVARAGRWILVGLGATSIVVLVWPLSAKVFPWLRLSHGSPITSTMAIAGIALAAVGLLCGRVAPDRWRSPRRIAAYAGLAGSLGLLLAGPAIRAAGARRAGDRPSVILVSIDTLRADRLGCLGNTRGLTPYLDALAAEGTLFEQATAAAPWTLPSHASVFLARLPLDHGVRRHWKVIPRAQVPLGELFREAGFRVGGFTGDVLVGSYFGFGQGFEEYLDYPELKRGGPAPIMEAALRWTRSVAGQPFFLFVHTYEPHTPFTHTELADPREAGRLPGKFTPQEGRRVVSGEMILTPNERHYVKDLYDGDVASADRIIGTLLGELRRAGILDHAILAVMSDHGEELWDREPAWSPGHAHTLYQELVRVPLLVRWPGHVPANRRIRTPVSLVDLGPTLLELAGLSPHPEHDGRSLASDLLRGGEPAELPVYSECTDYGTERFAVRIRDFKAIHAPRPSVFRNDVHLGGTFLEVFDLASDPGEHVDLAGSEDPRVVAVSRAILERARAKGLTEEEPNPEAVPEKIRERLRSLGYLR